MFCGNCGKEINTKFCPYCGAKSEEVSDVSLGNPTISPADIDIATLPILFKNNRIGAVKHVREQTGLSLSEAKSLVDKAYATAGTSASVSFRSPKSELKKQEKQDTKEHIKQMDRDGIAYCPKCHSTSLSANKKGFGIGKAVIGASLTMPFGGGILGAVAGNAGAKKVRITCLKCGHQFWAGKK